MVLLFKIVWDPGLEGIERKIVIAPDPNHVAAAVFPDNDPFGFGKQ